MQQTGQRARWPCFLFAAGRLDGHHTGGCLLPYFLPTPMRGEPCSFGHGGRIKEAEADSRPRSTNKQTTTHNCGSSLGAVPPRRDPISSGNMKPAQSMYGQVQSARARLVLRDSLILSMSRDKLPNVHCSRVGRSTPILDIPTHCFAALSLLLT